MRVKNEKTATTAPVRRNDNQNVGRNVNHSDRRIGNNPARNRSSVVSRRHTRGLNDRKRHPVVSKHNTVVRNLPLGNPNHNRRARKAQAAISKQDQRARRFRPPTRARNSAGDGDGDGVGPRISWSTRNPYNFSSTSRLRTHLTWRAGFLTSLAC